MIIEDGQHRYSLFHVKLYEYLRQDEGRPGKEYVFAKQEEAQWHKKLVAWCEQCGLSAVWVDMIGNSSEQSRRVYARNHYVTHLYLAREWNRLFEVLDTGHYGRAKLRHNFSMHPYVQDLRRGQEAAVCVEGGTEDFLPHLWRYTLLRCSLNSRADQYPLEAFSAFARHEASPTQTRTRYSLPRSIHLGRYFFKGIRKWGIQGLLYELLLITIQIADAIDLRSQLAVK